MKRLMLWGLAGVLFFGTARDLRAQSIYWSEYVYPRVPGSPTRIMRANSDGTGVQAVLNQGYSDSSGVFGGIALDPAHGYLYSGDKQFLFRTNLDGTGRVNLVPSSSAQQIEEIELDLAGG